MLPVAFLLTSRRAEAAFYVIKDSHHNCMPGVQRQGPYHETDPFSELYVISSLGL